MVANSSSEAPDNNLRRRRRVASTTKDSHDGNDDEVDSSGRDTGSHSHEEALPPPNNAPLSTAASTSSSATTSSRILWLLIHLAACGVYITGLFLQNELHSSVECSMTYSQRQLIPIPMLDVPEKKHPKYGLYKFVDQRDPRPHHKKMLHKWLHAVQKTTGGGTGTNDGNNYREATNAYLAKHDPFDGHDHHCPYQPTTISWQRKHMLEPM